MELSPDTNDRREEGRGELRKVLAGNGQVTIAAVDVRDVVLESMERLQSWPPATITLGQALLGGALLLSLSDKGETAKVELQWRVDGPFGNVFAEAHRNGSLRGTVLRPHAQVAELQPKIGTGLLQVRRHERKVFTGIVPSVGDIGNDLVGYIEHSEQKLCGVRLSVKLAWDEQEDDDALPIRVEHALGYLIHVMPQATEQETNMALLRWQKVMEGLGPIEEWALGADALGDMLRLLSGEPNPQQLFYQQLRFHCDCTRDRAARALALAAAAPEAKNQTSDEEVRCEFCGRTYTISPKDMPENTD